MPIRPPTSRELTDPEWAYVYARDFVRDRWPEGEAAIATNPRFSYLYARDLLGGEFTAGEPAIARNAKFSLDYADKVIRGRFIAGEPAIAQSLTMAIDYANNVTRGRFPAGEAVIFGTANQYYANNYVNMLKRCDPEGYAEFELERGDWQPDKIADKAVESARRNA